MQECEEKGLPDLQQESSAERAAMQEAGPEVAWAAEAMAAWS